MISEAKRLRISLLASRKAPLTNLEGSGHEARGISTRGIIHFQPKYGHNQKGGALHMIGGTPVVNGGKHVHSKLVSTQGGAVNLFMRVFFLDATTSVTTTLRRCTKVVPFIEELVSSTSRAASLDITLTLLDTARGGLVGVHLCPPGKYGRLSGARGHCFRCSGRVHILRSWSYCPGGSTSIACPAGHYAVDPGQPFCPGKCNPGLIVPREVPTLLV